MYREIAGDKREEKRREEKEGDGGCVRKKFRRKR